MDEVSPIRVLLADGDAVLRAVRSQLLVLHDDLQVVVEVDSGTEVLTAARLHNPDVAVIASSLSGGDVLAVTAELRSQVPECALHTVHARGRYIDQESIADALTQGEGPTTSTRWRWTRRQPAAYHHDGSAPGGCPYVFGQGQRPVVRAVECGLSHRGVHE
jgi:DNA-binding NarL/FixJ family response regulator